MKKIITLILAVCCVLTVSAKEKQYTDAQSLTVVGKLLNTTNPYHRLDVEKYEGLTSGEKRQAVQCTGMAIAFRTNSKYIGLKVNYTTPGKGTNSPYLATRGFDLYMYSGSDAEGIRPNAWVWAANCCPSKIQSEEWCEAKLLSRSVSDMKDCLLYLPLFSELNGLQIVTNEGSVIEPIDNPFRHRIAYFGSSYTHGSGCGRPAMAYVAQLSRMTGLQFINMGFSGNSKLQPYFADALIEADVDAYICDAFSNPNPEQVEDRLFPFIEKFQKAKPGVPLIFVQTIRRERRNFSPSYDDKEQRKMDTADRMMRLAVKKYKDVYWIDHVDLSEGFNECTSDGSHPDSYGYTLWAKSIREPILKILAAYEIK